MPVPGAQLFLCGLRADESFTFDDDNFHNNHDERETNLRRFAERAATGGPLNVLNFQGAPGKNPRKSI